MTLQFHPLAFGVMLVVAAGTLAYSLWTSSRQHKTYGTGRTPDYDIPTSFHPGYDTKEMREPPRRRKKNIEQCCICLGSLIDDLKTLTCQHKFHSNCISKWFISNDTCPVCRKVDRH